VALALVGSGALAHAQDARSTDSRDNPFLSTPTDEEDKRIAERERTRQVFREMMPEMKALIQEQVGAAKQQMQEEIKKVAADAVRQEPSVQTVNGGAPLAGALATAVKPVAASQSAAPSEFRGALVRTGLPDGAKYLACVNGKALYKDGKDGTRFYADAPCH
jgi:hypothetical protein